MLRAAPAITLLLVLAPILLGLGSAVMQATGPTWRGLLHAPGIAQATALSLVTGGVATLISLLLVAAFCAAFHDTRMFRLLRRLIGPVLAVPHAAMAIGLAFLIAPSGWVFRLLSPWATGLDRPPDLALVKDPHGLALIAGLVVKETPFLFLMALGALGQVDARRSVLIARTLGYRPATAWMRTVWPRLYAQLRLPVFAVLAFSISVVDMALILAPNAPPPLAVLITQWATDPDMLVRRQAAAGACLLLALTLAVLALWHLGERLCGWVTRPLRAGGRRHAWPGLTWFAGAAAALLVGAAGLGLAAMGLWSVAQSWRFPDPLPGAWTLAHWADAIGTAQRPFLTTLGAGLAAVAVSAVLVVACLENETRRRIRTTHRTLWLIYVPLLVPQVAFLTGVQATLVRTGLDGSWLGVTWSHILYVLPYVWLALADPYRALDDRYQRSARGLGASAARVFWRIKLALLLRPILIAAAVGFAVSVAQYLPTVFAGAGRVVTLTTEAVTLSAGGDRRIVGVYGVLQSVLPFAGFALALVVPAWLFRHRAGMRAFR